MLYNTDIERDNIQRQATENQLFPYSNLSRGRDGSLTFLHRLLVINEKEKRVISLLKNRQLSYLILTDVSKSVSLSVRLTASSIIIRIKSLRRRFIIY